MYNYENLEMENARELIKGVETRSSEMLTIMHQYTNYVILILAGIWAFFVNSFQNSITSSNPYSNITSISDLPNYILNHTLSNPSTLLIITIAITIIILIVWRLYVHYLDNGIARNYKKIILFEKRLYGNTNEVPESSLLFSLVNNIPELPTLLIDNDKKNYDQQAKVIFNLIDKGLIGSRGQQIFDLLTFWLVIILLAINDIILLLDPQFFSEPVYFLLFTIQNVGIIGISLIILLLPGKSVPFIQKDPEHNQILQIIRNGELSRSSSKILVTNICILVGVLVFFSLAVYAIYNLGYNAGRATTQKDDGQNLDEFFHNKFDSDYQIRGTEFISVVAEKSKFKINDLEKLNTIADLITQDFSDPFWRDNLEPDGLFHWEKNYYSNISGNEYKQFINKSSVMPQFWFEKRGRVRVNYIPENSFYRSPEWIASQQTGACEELSILFNATANKVGIETRIVRSDGAYNSGGHMWNEVNISGEWKFFDVQQYGVKKNTNNSAFWFGNRSEYSKNISPGSPCDLTKYGVYVLDTQQNGYAKPPITDAYDPNNQCPHGTKKINKFF